MPVMIVRYRTDGRIRWGAVEGAAPRSANDSITIRPLNLDAGTTAELIEAFESGDMERRLLSAVPVTARALLSPITRDASLICQGLNYADHAAEAQQHTRKQNLIFAKASSSITGAFEAIERPKDVQLLDYEVEFGVVMRKAVGRNTVVDPAAIGSYVAGVVLANDVSARDAMFGAPFLQWFQGKSYRTFCPMGPVLYLLAPGEVGDVLENLEIKLWVNEELRQSATSSQLIFKPAETIGDISRVLDLKRGDVILTGTPGGVTAPATPKLVEILKTHLLADSVRRNELRVEMSKGRPFLQPGDVVTASLHDRWSGRELGRLENPIAEER
jgi:2-keto-4-pentenoate hydratase/2-oxohepta-3-ene-1,7-dioic acid hydratase in catechol pathway